MRKVDVIKRAVKQSSLIKDCKHEFSESSVNILGRAIPPQWIGSLYYLPCKFCGLLRSEVDIKRAVKIRRSAKGIKKGDRVVTETSFGSSYSGTVSHITEETVGDRRVVYIHVRDGAGKVIGRNIKSVRKINKAK